MRREEYKVLFALDPEAKPSKKKEHAFDKLFVLEYAIIATIILIAATVYFLTK